jgi:hypothetical protein
LSYYLTRLAASVPNPELVLTVNPSEYTRNIVVVEAKLNLTGPTLTEKSFPTTLAAVADCAVLPEERVPKTAEVVTIEDTVKVKDVVGAGCLHAIAHTSQSPAVNVIEVMFVGTPVVYGTAAPTATVLETYSPTFPAEAESLVVVPTNCFPWITVVAGRIGLAIKVATPVKVEVVGTVNTLALKVPVTVSEFAVIPLLATKGPAKVWV